MIRKETEKKVADAYNLLKRHGILCYVPGCYDIINSGRAVLFAKDKEAFYRAVDPEQNHG